MTPSGIDLPFFNMPGVQRMLQRRRRRVIEEVRQEEEVLKLVLLVVFIYLHLAGSEVLTALQLQRGTRRLAR